MAPPEGYVEGFVCTLQTCSVSQWGFIKYQPTIPGNALFLAIILLLCLAQIYLGFKYHTATICVAMLTGLAFESTGYIARLLMHGDPFNRTFFLLYLICLTLGPVFFAAAIYLCLGKIVVVYGEGLSRWRPRTYTIFFVSCDAISLVVQGVGGGIAASFPLSNQYMIDLGTHILVAGLAFQVASLLAFTICCSMFLLKALRNRHLLNPEFADLYRLSRFKGFLVALAAATVCIFIRSVFRSVELSEGFGGHLANNEISFMVLDGVMVLVACFCLTAMHPGLTFGKVNWKRAGFQFRKVKGGDTEITTPEEETPRGEKGINQVVA